MKKRTKLPDGDVHIDKSKLEAYLIERIEKEIPSKIQDFVAPEPVANESTTATPSTEEPGDDLPF